MSDWKTYSLHSGLALFTDHGDKNYSATVLAHRCLTQVLYSILPSSLESRIMSWLDCTTWWLSTYKRWLFMSHIYFLPFRGHTSISICVSTGIVDTTRQLLFPADTSSKEKRRWFLSLPCEQQQIREFSELECACDCDYPTRQFGQSMFHQRPGLGESEQNRLTSQRTGGK